MTDKTAKRNNICTKISGFVGLYKLFGNFAARVKDGGFVEAPRRERLPIA